MKTFWQMVDEGRIKVLCEQACIDAWSETPDMDLAEFIEEAEEYGWIEETAR
jgi:hypothetical protein